MLLSKMIFFRKKLSSVYKYTKKYFKEKKYIYSPNFLTESFTSSKYNVVKINECAIEKRYHNYFFNCEIYDLLFEFYNYIIQQ